MLYLKAILVSSILFLFAVSCEDPFPTDYVPVNYVEAALEVGEPIKNIILMKSQPLNVEFDYENSLIRDAEIIISTGEKNFVLKTNPEGEDGYYYDGDYLVEEGKEYTLTINLADGATITGTTITPSAPIWLSSAPKTIQYPKDTINKASSDTLIWDGEPTRGFWGISVKALDTLEYGIYLDGVPASEMNRRVTTPVSDNPDLEWRYQEQSQWGAIPNYRTPVVWTFFKWYGLHEISIYNLDYNYQQWVFQRLVQREYDELLTSVEGDGIGVFGSFNAIRDTFFLIKNQP